MLNKANDVKEIKALTKEGWKVITIRECKLKPAKGKKTMQKLLAVFSTIIYINLSYGREVLF